MDLDNLADFFDDMEKASSDAHDTQVDAFELMSDTFISEHTKFSSFRHLLSSGNYNIKTLDDLQNILDSNFDKFLSRNTKFESWEEIFETAVEEYSYRIIGL